MMPDLRHSASDRYSVSSDLRASIGPTSNSSVISGAASDYTSSCSSSIDRDSFNYNLEPVEAPANPRARGSSGITKAFADCSLCGTNAPAHNCPTTMSPADILLPLAAAKKHCCPGEPFGVMQIPIVNVFAITEQDERAKKRSSTCTDVESKDLGSLLDIQFPLSYGDSYDNFVDIDDIGDAFAASAAVAASTGSSGTGAQTLSAALRCNIGAVGAAREGEGAQDLSPASSPEIGSVFVRGGASRSRGEGGGAVFEEKGVHKNSLDGRTSIECESGISLVARSVDGDGLMFDLEV